MGEFMGNSGDDHMAQNVTMGGEQQGAEGAEGMQGDSQEMAGYETDVSDVRSDDIVKQGKDEFPCFDVTDNEFYQNMQDGRRRLRFKSGSNAQKYMQNTKYNRPFFIRHTDKAGKKFVRKIK